MRLAVTGATGYLGAHFAKRAQEAGHDITAIVRSKAMLTEGINTIVVGDIRQLKSTDLSGMEAVVHFAAGTTGTKEDMLGITLEGSLHVFRQAAISDVHRFVHVSSLSVYPGRPPGALLPDEGRSLDPHPERRGAYAEAKIAADKAIQDAFAAMKEPRIEACIVRPGLVYGPDMKGAVLGGSAVLAPLDLAIGIGRPHHHVPVIDREDLAHGLIALVESTVVLGRLSVWNALSPDLPTKREWLAEYRRITARAQREVWIPELLALAVAGLVEATSRIRRSRRDLPYKVRRAYQFDPSRLDATRFWRHVSMEATSDPVSSLEAALTTRPARMAPEHDSDLDYSRAGLILETAMTKSMPKSMPKPLSRHPVLLIGAGRVATELHVPALGKLPTYELKAVVDPNLRLAHRIAAMFPDVGAFPSIDDIPDNMLRGATAVIATPGITHHDLACRLLDRGLHVIVEKPAALSRSEFESLKAHKASSGREVTVLHNYRLRQNSLRLWQFITEHRPGALVKASLTFHSGKIVNEPARWQHYERRHRVLVLDFAIHFLDLLCVIAGPLKVSARPSVVMSADQSTTLSVMATAAAESGAEAFIDLDLSGTSQRTALTLDFERSSCLLEFFPEAFRVLPVRRHPLDDLAADWGGIVRYVAQRASGRGLPSRARPHFLIYMDHLSRVSAERSDSAFRLNGVEPTMLSLYDLCEHVYPPHPAPLSGSGGRMESLGAESS